MRCGASRFGTCRLPSKELKKEKKKHAFKLNQKVAKHKFSVKYSMHSLVMRLRNLNEAWEINSNKHNYAC